MNAVLAERPSGLIVYDRPIEVYHGDTQTVSKSGLDDIAKSPAIYYARHIDPARPDRPEPTPAMQIGTMAHCAILEPDQFDSRYVVGPDADKRTKAWKEWEAQIDPDQIPIKPAEREMAFAQAESLKKIEPIREMLAAGRAEVSAYWNDQPTGIVCRCRPDWVHEAGNGVILLDVKTCPSADPEDFVKSIVNWRYDVQAAFYTDGYAAASGLKVHAFVFAAVEKEYPYAASACMLTEEDIEAGRRKYRRNLSTLAECRRSLKWPGYSEEITLVTLPAWAKD
jgi:PDDEXK-like domain of unknown function (DUF3799)